MEKPVAYWFALEPYVYLELKGDRGLLYNTLDAAHIEVEDKEVLSLLEKIYDSENGGVIGLSDEILKNEQVASFVAFVREKFMGDLYPKSLSSRKPVQLYPLLNFQQDKRRVEESHGASLGDDILSNLYEVTVYVSAIANDLSIYMSRNDVMNFEDQNSVAEISSLCSFLEPVLTQLPVINIKGGIFQYPHRKDLLRFLNNYTCKKQYFISFSEVGNVDLLSLNEKNRLFIYVDQIMSDSQWGMVLASIEKVKEYCSFIFLVDSEEHYASFSDVSEKHHLSNVTIFPRYNGSNQAFFEKYVYLSKEDILSEILKMKDIFMHKALNMNDFGKISILSNGDVYANVKHGRLGNISENSIQEILFKELKSGKSWLRVRNQGACISCIYQWICPSPSDYELALEKTNLCHL